MAGLYIHIPFCEHKCAYCDFYSRGGPSAGYPEAAKNEMSARRDFLSRLDTIYIGGGTPTLFAPEQLQDLLDHAAKLWDCSALGETTLEANPEDLTADYLARLADTAFDRLSIGIQSFDDGLLRTMNRRHSAARALEAVREAQRRGFANISIDLIFGIPGMSMAQWERTLDKALGLGVQHLSAYHLTIEPGTEFGRMALRDELRPIDEAESERQYELLRRKAADAGLEHYEISNFALPDFRAVHNSAYWSGGAYLGIGPSAHSFDGSRKREWVVPNTEKYMAAFATWEAGTVNEAGTIYEGETLSGVDLHNERVMLSLRRVEGIEEALLPAAKVRRLLDAGLLERRGERVVVPPEKFLLADYVIGEFFRE